MQSYHIMMKEINLKLFNILTIARVYAKAAFDLSIEKNTVEEWRLILEFFAKISTYDLVRSLLFKYLAPKKMANVFIAVCEDIKKQKMDVLFKNFIFIMSEKNRLLLLPVVFDEFNVLYFLYYKCIIKVKVISVWPLNADQNDRIAAMISKRFGRMVNITNIVDRNILAGILIQVGDMIIDGSMRGRILRLKDHILQF